MIDRNKLFEQAKAYVKKHPPNTGYTLRAMETVCATHYPQGTNLMVQFALQFDGAETVDDLTKWDSAERRLPYADSRSLDKASDCSSFVQNVYDIFFGFDIGTWTEAQWKNYKHRQVAFKDLRPCDLIFWNFKKNRTVSHVAMYIGNGRIIHTTSPGNPLRVESAGYSASKRVGCVRIVTDEQYASLLYSDDDAITIPVERGDEMIKKGDRGANVKAWQGALITAGYVLPKYGADASFGSETEGATKGFQKDNRLKQTGRVDATTMATMLTTLRNNNAKVALLEGRIAAAKKALG